MKNIIITDASSGIGREAARVLIGQGHRVLGCARREQRLNKIREELGELFIPCPADLSKSAGIENIFAQADREFDQLDILVNNAGVGYESTILEGKTSEWQRMFDVNVMALTICMRKALDRMRDHNAGDIVNISSMSAHRVTLGGGIYAASKHAVKAITEGLRQELCEINSKIRVTSISPGFVETEFYEHYYKDMEEKERDCIFTEMKALESKDVVTALMYILNAPAHVGVNDILMRPLQQLS